MADVPPQRITGRCSPQRPDETDDDYFVRFKAHRDAWRQQILDDYHKSKDARLPSPNSEEDLDKEEMAQLVFQIESDIRVENGLAQPGDLPTPVVWPPVVYPPGKSLSETSEYEPGPYSPVPRGRPEDLEYDPLPISSPIPESTSMRKRSRSPAEDGGAFEPLAKRRRTERTSEVPTIGPSTSGHKRKRLEVDEPQVAHEQAPADFKKRRINTRSRPSRASVPLSSKRKRGSGPDESCGSELQATQPGREVSRAKRRKVHREIVTNNAATGGDRSRAARVTRARRRQLSGKDAQLFQLGARGQLDLQGEGYATQGQVTDAAANRSERQPSSAATNNVKPTANNTEIDAKD